MRTAIILAFVSLIGYHQPPKIQGTYKYSWGKNSASGLIEIHYINSNTIVLYLEANRGKPDYNSGAMYRRMILNKKTGNYESVPRDTFDDCLLIFIRQKDKIIIKTTIRDCPLGYGVSADGTYLLKDPNNPKSFIDRHNHKIYFDKTTPEKYLE